MKQICRNCHFFAKEYREENTGRALSFSVSTKERNKIEMGDIDAVKSHYSLKCQRGVWDEGISLEKENRLCLLNKIGRKNTCFFFPYNPNMMFSAASELQKRAQENQQLKRSNMYTRIGLWVAALALLINAVVNLLKLAKLN